MLDSNLEFRIAESWAWIAKSEFSGSIGNSCIVELKSQVLGSVTSSCDVKSSSELHV